MRALMLCVVVLTACGGGRQELRQAAAPAPMVRLAPSTPTVGGYTPIGTGLPGERMPDGTRQRLERSPNKSVKPVKGEDTMYQADGVKATRKAPDVRWLDPVYLPPINWLENDAEMAKRCSAMLAQRVYVIPPELMKAVNDSELEHNMAQLPCLTMKLYFLCLERELAGVKGAKDALADAFRTMKARCPEHADTPAVNAVVEAVRQVQLH